MFSNQKELSFKESSRLLFAQVDALKDSLYADLKERFKQDNTITEQEQKWKLAIMVSSISTALFSSSLVGNKEYPVLYTYFKIKINEYDSNGEAALEDCMGLIADLMARSEYDPGPFTDTIAMWLYFHMRGKEELVLEESAAYMLVAQFIHNNFYNWFDSAR
ncbi:hypothetical protein [Paenibacillus sp. sgz302251]|uniref:hypothetical protein n=1 Tax=Paenibacillus sp. sgz302251 TaxID=3414493 RepID=UPI003C7D52A6